MKYLKRFEDNKFELYDDGDDDWEDESPTSKPKSKHKRPWWDYLLAIPGYDKNGTSIWESKEIDWDDIDDDEDEYFEDKYIIFGAGDYNYIGQIVLDENEYKIKLLNYDHLFSLDNLGLVNPDGTIATSPNSYDDGLSLVKTLIKYPNSVTISIKSILYDITNHPEKYLTKINENFEFDENDFDFEEENPRDISKQEKLMPEKLKKFLIKNDAFDEYIHNVKNSKTTDEFTKQWDIEEELFEFSLDEIIVQSFSWLDSKEGFQYWSSIQHNFVIELDSSALPRL